MPVTKTKTYESAVRDILMSVRLSPIAFRVLCEALLLPEAWTFHLDDLAKRCCVTRNTIKSAIAELSDWGFVSGSFKGGLTFFDVSTVSTVPTRNIPNDTPNDTPNDQVSNFDSSNSVQCQNLTLEQGDLVSKFDSKCQNLTPSLNLINKQLTTTRETREETADAEKDSHKPKQLPAPEKVTQRNFTLDGSLQLNAANVRGIVEFGDPKIAALRKRVSHLLWCDGIRRDVIDRATAAIVLHFPGASLDDYDRIVKRSWDESRDSSRPRWGSINLAIARIYESVQPPWTYPATNVGNEPKPLRSRQSPIRTEDQQSLSPDDNPDTENLIREAKRFGIVATEPLEMSISRIRQISPAEPNPDALAVMLRQIVRNRNKEETTQC